MGLTRRRGTTTNRWVGTDEHGRVIGHVGKAWWPVAQSIVERLAQRRLTRGIEAGRFDTAEEAIAAVDDLA
jgi:hypothetical protein